VASECAASARRKLPFQPRKPADQSCGAAQGRERGGGSLKAIVWTAILVMGAIVAIKVVPVYVTEYELNDKMQEQARFGVINGYSEEQIRDEVFKVVQDLEIPAKREDIKVSATRQVVRISLDYAVHVNLLIYQMDLHFSPSAENRSLV
jgi:hypothetical protein